MKGYNDYNLSQGAMQEQLDNVEDGSIDLLLTIFYNIVTRVQMNGLIKKLVKIKTAYTIQSLVKVLKKIGIV